MVLIFVVVSDLIFLYKTAFLCHCLGTWYMILFKIIVACHENVSFLKIRYLKHGLSLNQVTDFSPAPSYSASVCLFFFSPSLLFHLDAKLPYPSHPSHIHTHGWLSQQLNFYHCLLKINSLSHTISLGLEIRLEPVSVSKFCCRKSQLVFGAWNLAWPETSSISASVRVKCV